MVNIQQQKKRVLQFISTKGMYGAEFWILALIKNLNPDRVETYIAAPLDDDNQQIELLERAKTLGFRTKIIKMKGKFNPLGIINLFKIIKKEKIDIIHTHGYKSNIMGIIAAKIAHISSINTPHGFEIFGEDKKLKLYMYFDKMTYRCFDYIAPLSKELCMTILQHKIAPKKIKLITNGIDLDGIEAERKNFNEANEITKKKKTIGYIGQLIPRKNLYDIIKAFDLLIHEQKGDHTQLLIIGEGIERASLENYAKALKAGPYINFIGYRNDRLRFLKIMNIFTMASSLEGIPRCMMEAMAMRKPVVAYNIPGINELIIH